jgi:hypothetical protein
MRGAASARSDEPFTSPPARAARSKFILFDVAERRAAPFAI